MITVPESPWGPVTVAEQDVILLADALGKTFDECLHLLRSYRSREFAEQWKAADPQHEDEIRRFYGETQLYLTELLLWNASEDYQPMLDAVRVADQRTAAQGRCALDHGSGVGTVALELLRCGYRTTIADVPGPTFDFAQRRIASRGYAVSLLPVLSEEPNFGVERFDLITSFDVLEHVSRPREVASRLVTALRPGGLFAVQATFTLRHPDFPHHLEAGAVRFGGRRWELFLSSLGLRPVQRLLWQRAGRLECLARRVQYELWRRTGVLLFQRVPR